jgi:tetratricopeptide (TPR) repeat protein
MYYLLGNYEQAKEVVSAALSAAESEGRIADVWPRLYYRLAKAYEGLQDYDAMCSAYNKMYEMLPEEDRNKKLKHMQDYYNKDICYLKHWVIKHGGYFDKLDIEYYDIDYRGMVACKFIKDSEIIIKIPKICILDAETCAKDNPYLSKYVPTSVMHQLDAHIKVALRILHDKNTNGFYMPYIRCFPKLYDNVIYNYSKHELYKLKGSIIFVNIVQYIVRLIHIYNIIATVNNDIPFTIKDLVWAYTAVSSRTYGSHIDNKSTSCMVPISDMANHAHVTNAGWGYNQYSNSFEVCAIGDIKPGEHIYETYGSKGNFELLQVYGFTLQDNIYDKSYLICNPVIAALYSKYINNIITSITDTSNLLEHIIFKLSSIDFRYTNLLFTSFGIFEIKYLYDVSVLYLFQVVRSHEVPKSRRSEREMLNNILFLIKNSLDAFPLSRQEYADILNNEATTFNMRNIATLCIGEIDVLGFWKVMCEQIIEILSEPAPTQVLKTLCERLTKYPYIVTFKPYIDLLENLPEEDPPALKAEDAPSSVPDQATTAQDAQ